jgi:protein TIF31
MTDEEKEHASADPAEKDDIPMDQVTLSGLLILPPRQAHHASEASHAVPLPPLRAEEPVQSLRAALVDVVGYAHLTSFRFEIIEKPATSTSSLPVISPYTGKDAVVSVPLSGKSLEPSISETVSYVSNGILEEYGNLTPLVLQGWTQDKQAALQIVLERYDVAGIRDHVQRFRTLVSGNAPTVSSLEQEEDESSKGVSDKDSPQSASVPRNGVEHGTPQKPISSLPAYRQIERAVDGAPNLKNFFYYVSGEDPSLYDGAIPVTTKDGTKSQKKKHKSKSKSKAEALSADEDEVEQEDDLTPEEAILKLLPRWNELDYQTKVPISVQYGGFHPPPTGRRLLGDLAYLEVRMNDDAVIHITATPTGFYVNNCSITQKLHHFDPSPAADSCFSHTLLDCLLLVSDSFCEAWTRALTASRERVTVIKRLNQGPILSLFRLAARGDFDGFPTASSAATFVQQQLDGSLLTPSWLVPKPARFPAGAWNGNQFHSYNTVSAEEDICKTFGVDLRNGGIRDWNEELQMAREMPVSTLTERIERARLLHKVMTEFGEASLVGIKSIVDGHISPMNPNEGARSQVFLHNNIFFSRAVDAGPETFKVTRGDGAARKAANRDIQCISTLHRSETIGLYTLATVLIDYLGTRFVCQSILPGILIGEKSHTLLYGSVEAKTPIKWDEELHTLAEQSVGEAMMVATRPVFRYPLTDERVTEIQSISCRSAEETEC